MKALCSTLAVFLLATAILVPASPAVTGVTQLGSELS